MVAHIPVKSYYLHFFAKNVSRLEMQQLLLWIGDAIWWVIEPCYNQEFHNSFHIFVFFVPKLGAKIDRQNWAPKFAPKIRRQN
jgi:hypothetical protein